MGFSLFEIRTLTVSRVRIDDSQAALEFYAFSGSIPDVHCLVGLIATSDDTIDHVVQIWVSGASAATPNKLFSTIVPAGAGNGTVPPVDLLAGFVPLPGGLFYATANQEFLDAIPVVMTPGKMIYLTATVGSF